MVQKYQQHLGEAYCASLPTLGQSLGDILAFFGCHRLYGIGGDFAANMIAALAQRLELLPCGNEMHAGFSACAQAELEGCGFCFTTYTVGSLPCTSAAALAKAEQLPVVFISGAPGESEVYGEAIHHTVHAPDARRPEYDAALSAFAALGIKSERLQGARHPGQPNVAAERFLKLVAHAYRKREAVFIEIPRDLINAPTQAIRLPRSLSTVYRETSYLDGGPLIEREIRARLERARYPLLYIGEKIRLNTALMQLLLLFCTRCNIPFATSWFAKSTLDEGHHLSLGAYNGVFSRRRCRQYIEREVDYILEVGTSVYPRDANCGFGSGTHKVDKHPNKTLLKGTAAHEQDLVALFKRLLGEKLPRFEFAQFEFDRPSPLQPPPQVIDKKDVRLDFHNLTDVLNDLQHTAAFPFIYLPEVGSAYFASYGLATQNGKVGRAWLTNPWYGAMGTSLAYARAVCHRIRDLNSDERVIVISGDGGFHFQANELIHFQREKLALTIVLMRNNIFHLGKQGDCPVYQCSDPAFDALALVKAYGGTGKRCSNIADFRNYLQRCTAENNGIRLIEVQADPAPENQCWEVRLINLFVQHRNGSASATKQWHALCSNELKCNSSDPTR